MDCDMGGVPGEGGTEPEAWVTELERRRASRLDRLFRGVKLRVDDQECLAVVRDASPYGLRLRLYHGLPEHRRLAIELANGECHPLQLVWHNGDNAGVFFVEPIDYEAFLRALNERGVPADVVRVGPMRRHLRVNVHREGYLRAGGSADPVVLNDISQGGACITCNAWLSLAQPVTVDAAPFPHLEARVRWRDHPRYGLAVTPVLAFDELARLVAASAGFPP